MSRHLPTDICMFKANLLLRAMYRMGIISIEDKRKVFQRWCAARWAYHRHEQPSYISNMEAYMITLFQTLKKLELTTIRKDEE